MTALAEYDGRRRLRVAPPVPEADRRVLVSVVSWNTRELTRACLRSVFASSCAGDLEVVVVDNGSTDGTADMIECEFPGVHVVRNVCNEGFARANNQAFSATTSPYVLLLNTDAEVEPETIDRCRAVLEGDRTIGAVGCRIVGPDGMPRNSVFRYPSLWGVLSTSLWLVNAFPNHRLLNRDRYGSTVPGVPIDVEVVMGSFLMTRRADVGARVLDDGFFMYAEEADLCRRLHDAGLRVLHLPEVGMTHLEGASTRTAGQLAWSYEAKKRSQLRYLWKWHGAWVAYLANAIMLIGMAPRSIGWTIADARTVHRGGEDPGRRLRARSLAFHFRAVIQPSYMNRRQAGPPDR
jgi:hypothetical protein